MSISLNDIENLSNEQSALGLINQNFNIIESEINNTPPGILSQDLDANSKKIINLPIPSSPHEPVRYLEWSNRIEQGLPGPQGETGETGPAGPSGTSSDGEYTASSNVSGHKVVALTSSGVRHADPTVLGDANIVVGISTNAASSGQIVIVRNTKTLQDNSFSFTPGNPLFLGLSGVVSQIIPVGALFALRVGAATKTDEMLVNIEEPIILA